MFSRHALKRSLSNLFLLVKGRFNGPHLGNKKVGNTQLNDILPSCDILSYQVIITSFNQKQNVNRSTVH